MEVSESIEISTSRVSNAPETPKFGMDFIPQTEEELIGFAKWIKSNEQTSVVVARHCIGTKMKDFYQKDYGKDKLQKIANETGYSKSSLQKSFQFARKYSEAEVEILTSGAFSLSWRDIAQNLTISSMEMINAYQASTTLDEFRNSVTRLKPPKDSENKKILQKKERMPRRQLEDKLKEYHDLLILKDEEIDELKTELASIKVQLKNLAAQDVRYDNYAMIDAMIECQESMQH